MEKFAVVGNPIEHSQSPIIHQAFAKQFAIELEFLKILAPHKNLCEILHDFFNSGGKGVSITLPFKEEAQMLVDLSTPEAIQSRTVNAISLVYSKDRKKNLWQGHNTDGIGLVRDLKHNHKFVLAGKKILIMGTGGACRGILGSLLAENPQLVVVASRTMSKAEIIRQEFISYGNINTCALTELNQQAYDFIFNATSASVKGEELNIDYSIAKGAVCYDLAYGPQAIPFLAKMKKAGAMFCFDGLGMLVEQAAEAFYIWHGVRPKTVEVLQLFKTNIV